MAINVFVFFYRTYIVSHNMSFQENADLDEQGNDVIDDNTIEF